MIWFHCSQCERQHSRPSTSAGSLIFCDCGNSITVPWESTIPEPEAPEAPPSRPKPPPPPKLAPIPVGEERIPVVRPVDREEEPSGERRPPRVPDRSDRPLREPRPLRDPRDRRGERDRRPPPRDRGAPRRRDKLPRQPKREGYCLDHPDLRSTGNCEECEEGFCSNCLVPFQGRMLCGPCKNLLVHRKSQGFKYSLRAIIAAGLGLAFSPFAICFGSTLLRSSSTRASLPWLFFLLILPIQCLALVLGTLSLLKMQKQRELQGQTFALTGVLGGMTGLVTGVIAVLCVMAVT
ncbi:MAG: hypothetical protein ACFCD0_13435 [Gemmataceae bacterium]